MSVLPVGFGGSSGGIDTGDIGHSLRCRSAASAYLNRTPASAGNRQKYTLSMWIKRGALGTIQVPFAALNGANNDRIYIDAANTLAFYLDDGIAAAVPVAGVFRDPTTAFHLLIAVDTTQATAADRVKIYVNGNIATLSSPTYPTLNYQGGINNTVVHRISSSASSVTAYMDGYLSRVCLVDGTALTPSSFGYLNTEINEWVSKSQSEVKAVVDAGGTNSFMLDFDDATSLTTLGYDKSSKGNNWTLNNFSLTAGTTYDHMLDVPGNSFATLNPLKTTLVPTNANLYVTANSVNGSRGSMAVAAGKWYWEVDVITQTVYSRVGVHPADLAGNVDAGYTSSSCTSYEDNGNKGLNGTPSAYGSSWTNGDLIGVALDCDANTVTFYKNGVSQGAITLFTSAGTTLVPFVMDDNNTSSVYNLNFGQAPLRTSATYHSAAGGYFRYAPPTGFKALCQANLENTTVTVSGTFTGNAAADGPFVWCNGVPKTLTINGNAVTFGTHADKTAGGFKLRTSSSSYNTAGSNTWTATIDSDLENCFKYRNAQGNP